MLQDIIEFYQTSHWIYRVFTVVFVVVVINLVVRMVLAHLHKRIRDSETIWDDALYDAINPPLRFLIWIIGIGIAADLVEPLNNDTIFAYIDPTRRVAVIATFVWFLVRLIEKIESAVLVRAQLRGQSVDRTTVEAMAKLVRLSVIITGVLVVLQTLGFSISGVLAFGGIGGIAVGFAAKDMLANLFGGLTVYMDRPFSVGDWIRSPNVDIEGTVENIGWRSTRIRRFDKRPIYVPNSLFTSIVVENPSRMTNRRINETIGIRYADAARMNEIVKAVREYLTNHEAIDQKQTIIVNFNAYNASSLDFFIYCLTKTTNWVEYHEIKHAILIDIHDIVTQHGAEFAFPTRTLHMIPENAEAAAHE